ncbi:MAG: M18 family aminopeptidase [Sphaerochaetaceae bacterium]|nr:M18 family aminopeptidase [Sphaerochaetaceae bacterium]
MEQKYLTDTRNLMTYILMSPSPFHAVAVAAKELEEKGFIALDEKKPFSVKRGGSYFVTRNSSALIAFRIPQSFKGFHISSAHTDAPCLKIKWNPDVKAKGLPSRLNVETYGGLLLQSWFDRPLSIAGRVYIKRGDRSEEKLVNMGQKYTVLIPNLAIHQNREANNGWKISVQKEMLPLFSDSDLSFMDALALSSECRKEDILDYELFLYNRTSPTFWGAEGEYFSSPKIDDLGCAWSALEALKNSQPKDHIALCALFDNEETGSGTKQGALSDFLYSVTQRIMASLGLGEEERYMMYASSRMVSADNGHAVHPAWKEKSDITNMPRMNGGVLVKYSASQKYTTDGESGAYIRSLMERNSIPYQVFHNNSDVAGGSTLGNLSSQKVSISTCDVGCAQLSMHSSYESGGTKDTSALLSMFSAFYED